MKPISASGITIFASQQFQINQNMQSTKEASNNSSIAEAPPKDNSVSLSDSINAAEVLPFADYADPQLILPYKDLIDTSCASLVAPFVKLKEIYNNPAYRVSSQTQANLINQFHIDQTNARYILEKTLAIFVQQKTLQSNTLTTIWNYFTNKSPKTLEGAEIDNLRKEIQRSTLCLLDHWVIMPMAKEPTVTPSVPPTLTDKGTIKVPPDNYYESKVSFPTTSRSAFDIFDSYLLVNDELKFITLNNGVFKIFPTPDIANQNGSKPEVTLKVADATSLEDIVNNFAHTLVLSFSGNVKTKISVPYPDQVIGFRWLRAIATLFIIGRLDHMKSQKGNEIVQETALQLIFKYSEAASTYDRATIVKNGGMKCIIEAMNSFPSNYFIQNAGCGAVQNLTMKNDYNKLVAGKEGSIETVLRAMQKFPDQVDFQILALRTLTGLSFGVEYNKVMITTYGLKMILETMMKFKKDSELQIVAMGCLANLSSLDENNKILIAKHNGISVILYVMKENQNEFTLQYYGLGALLNLCTNDSNRNIMLAQGGIPCIIAILKRFPEIYEIAYRGLCTLLTLSATGDETIKEKIRQEGATQCLQIAKQNFGQEELRDVISDVIAALKPKVSSVTNLPTPSKK